MDKSLVKNILIIIGVVIIVIIAYAIFANKGGVGNQNEGSLVSSSGLSPTAPAAAQQSEASSFSNELVVLLNSLESLSLNDSILFNQAFKELKDISIPLLREGNEGRPNPFAPIGSNSGSFNSVSTQTQDDSFMSNSNGQTGTIIKKGSEEFQLITQ